MLNIYTPDITHLPLLLIKVYRYSNAKPVSLCLGNYSDISSHTLSMTCIGNHVLNKHIQSKFGRKKTRSGFFWEKPQKLLLASCGSQSQGDLTTTNDILSKEKSCFAFTSGPTPLICPGPDQPWAVNSSPQAPTVLWKGTEKAVSRWVQLLSPRSSNKEQKHGSCVVSQNTGNWEYVPLVLMLWHVCRPLSCGTCF